MITTTISDFRKDIKQYFNRVTENFETLIINRGKNSGVVVISLEEYNALRTTQHELSSSKNEKRLDAAIEKFKNDDSFDKDLIETLEAPLKFDIILMHNSINHIGEDIIEEAKIDERRYAEFVDRLKPIIDRLDPGGTIIVSDCGTKNFWDRVGLKSPLAPTIEWSLHGEPEFWQKMLESLDCIHVKTNWTTRREFGKLGKLFLANRFMSYFTTRHFVSFYKKG